MSYKDDEFDPRAEEDVDFDGAAILPDFLDEEDEASDIESALDDEFEETEEEGY